MVIDPHAHIAPLSFIEDVRRDRGDILLASMRENVFSVFDLLGFQVLFTITTTVDQAQQEFRSRQ